MKLIIDIPDDMYYAIEHRYWSVVNEAVLLQFVAKGTPLPKGHGDLKDADEIKKNQFTLGTSNYCEYKVVTIETIDKADIIIEADKAESEDI